MFIIHDLSVSFLIYFSEISSQHCQYPCETPPGGFRAVPPSVTDRWPNGPEDERSSAGPTPNLLPGAPGTEAPGSAFYIFPPAGHASCLPCGREDTAGPLLPGDGGRSGEQGASSL